LGELIFRLKLFNYSFMLKLGLYLQEAKLSLG